MQPVSVCFALDYRPAARSGATRLSSTATVTRGS
jgi:hypothetical protein